MPELQPVRPKLIAIPYAGGNAISYRALKPHLERDLDFLTLEAPGHGRRLGEPFAASVDAIAVDLAEIVRAETKSSPYVLFGHSMGALLAIPLVRALRDKGAPLPSALIVSGAYPPGRRRLPNLSHLASGEFIERVAALGGLPREILAEPELMAFFEPILRSDFQLIESYRHSMAEKLAMPITLFLGQSDSIAGDEAQIWAEETTGRFTLKIFPGGHFFVLNEVEAVAHAILQTCQMSLPARVA
jgi:surfactin synthase thioesterase subunit